MKTGQTFCLLISVVAIGSCLNGQGTASGTLTINKDTFQLKYAAAMRVPDSFDKKKLSTRIVLTDKPFPADLVEEESEVWDLKSQGIHGLELTVDDDKSSLNLFIISSTLEGSISRSTNTDAKAFPVLTPKRAEGTVMSGGDQELGGTKYSYNVKFATDLAQAAPPPTAADAAAAAGKESTKAYLALVQAIRTGNKQAILDMSPPDKRAMIDTKEFPQMLKMVQAMQAQNIKVLKATETADKATLIASGTESGKPQRGKITLNKQNGKWVMANESWRPE